jgi:hypothetical protein
LTGAAAAAGSSAAASGRRGGTRWLFVTGLSLLVLPYLPGIDTDFGRSLLTQMAIAAVFALSFNLLFGQTGLLSFGHAVYFGLSGYAAIRYARDQQGLPPMVLVPLAGAAGRTVRWPGLRCDDDATIGDDLCADFARRRRADVCGDVHAAGSFRRRRGHHGQPRARYAALRRDARFAASCVLRRHRGPSSPRC